MIAGRGLRTFYVDAKGRVQDALKIALKSCKVESPEAFQVHHVAIKDILRKLAGKLDIKNAAERVKVNTRAAVLSGDEFRSLWDRIKHKTTYRVQFDNEKLIQDCTKAISEVAPISKARMRIRKAGLSIGQSGVEAKDRDKNSSSIVTIEEGDIVLSDVITDLQDLTQLTRRSTVEILRKSNRLPGCDGHDASWPFDLAQNMGRTGCPPPWIEAGDGRAGAPHRCHPAPDVGRGCRLPCRWPRTECGLRSRATKRRLPDRRPSRSP